MKKQETSQTETMVNKTKKKVSKKAIIGYSSLGVSVIAVGIIAGILVGRNVFKYDAYAGMDITDAETDYNEVYEKYKKTDSSKYFSEFNNVELANISLLKLGDYENFYTITEGNVEAAGVKQTIHGTTIKDGNEYFEEAISASSFVKSANRFYQDDDGAVWHKGKYVDINTGDYSSAKKTNYTIDEFNETWGKSLTRACIYIVSDKSCLSSTINDNGDGTYTIDVDLDPTLSVLRYVKQMVMTGGLSEAPVFHSVKLTFVVDKDVNLLTFKTNEVYDVHMVIDAKNSKGSLTQQFKYEERNIPQLEEVTDYNY